MYDLTIIGAGPGGYVAALRASQLGMKTLLIEGETVGGMCLNWGCIPIKSLLESARRMQELKNAADYGIDGINLDSIKFNWLNAKKQAKKTVHRLTRGVEFLLNKYAVEKVSNFGYIQSENRVKVGEKSFDTKNIIVATGSKINNLPKPLNHALNTKDLFKLESIPDKIFIYGWNLQAVELAQFFRMTNHEVFLIQKDGDEDLYIIGFFKEFILKKFKREKIGFLSLKDVLSYENQQIQLSSGEQVPGLLINCSNREAALPQSPLNFSKNKGWLQVNDYFQTSYANIYGVGDVNGKMMFAHSASAQGLMAVNHIKGIKKKLDFTKIPVNIYTSPEMAQVGKTEEQAKKAGFEPKVSEFPLSANGKALIEGDFQGKIRIIYESKYGEVLGVQIIAPHATDLISEASLLLSMEGTVYDLASTIHAHPTISEIYQESGFAAFGEPIHK